MRQDEILDKLLQHLNNERAKFREVKLTALMAIKGRLATGELMVIGRAVNGWLEGWEPESLNDEARKRIMSEVKKVSAPGPDDPCPLAWVTRMWGNKDGYDSSDSAFWRVIRKVVQGFAITDVASATWSCHLIWSNLYKVAPSEGGNPSERLARVQEELCIELLAEELREWAPARVLFLTGLDWAGPFLDGLKAEIGVRKEEFLVQAAGRIPVGTGQWGRFVVARHPQGKPEDEIASGIKAAFEPTSG